MPRKEPRPCCENCGADLDDWQDADRTMTPVELSKWGPGWIDN